MSSLGIDTVQRPPKPTLRAASLLLVTAAAGCALDGFEVEQSSGAGATSSASAAQGGAPSASGASGSGAAAGSSADTGSAGSGAYANGGSSGGESDCTNGIDDDGDTAVDCLDGDCGGHVCAPAVPSGWSGPIEYRQGRTPAVCEGPWSVQGLAGDTNITAAPANCGACSCGNATGLACGSATIGFWTLTDCIGMAASQVTATTACSSVSVPISVSAEASAIPVTGGSCPASGGGVVSIPPVAKDAASICSGAPLGGGCGTGACAPAAAGPSSICVYRSGAFACEGGYSVPHVLYTGGVNDGRGCSSCSCGAPSGSCVGSVDLYGGSSCATVIDSVPADNVSCLESVPNVQSIQLQVVSGPSGTCAPNGGAATGGVSGNDPVTICCLP